MKYQDFIKVARNHTVTNIGAKRVIDDLLCAIKEALKKGERVELKELCTMAVVDAAAATRRNPRTGEPISLPAKKRVRVRISSKVKEMINS